MYKHTHLNLTITVVFVELWLITLSSIYVTDGSPKVDVLNRDMYHVFSVTKICFQCTNEPKELYSIVWKRHNNLKNSPMETTNHLLTS